MCVWVGWWWGGGKSSDLRDGDNQRIVMGTKKPFCDEMIEEIL